MALLRRRVAPPHLSPTLPMPSLLAPGLLALTLWLSAVGLAQAEDNPLETAVKASYLYKFAPFVNWPPSAFPSPNSPLAICIFGLDPFGSVLDRAVAGQNVGGREIVVRRLSDTHEIDGCQILFIGRLPGATTTDLSHILAGKPILTVSDASRGDNTGMIALVEEAGRVRFKVDADLAQANGLTLSSKLLSLALAVHRTAR